MVNIPRSFESKQPLKVSRTESFARDFKRLPKDIREHAERAIRLLAENPHYPSLRTKKMQGPGDVWEASVSLSWRMTFHWRGDELILRRIGTHDILKQEGR
jgi:mRNA-degrading endonuclease YafQ of YafQ-DinJ toxin-antitoxin module